MSAFGTMFHKIIYAASKAENTEAQINIFVLSGHVKQYLTLSVL